VNRHDIDNEISGVEELLRAGVVALLAFQHPSGLFLRDTRDQRQPMIDRSKASVAWSAVSKGDREALGATSTNRSVAALCEAGRALAEIGRRDDEYLRENVHFALERAAARYANTEHSSPLRRSGENKDNLFTDSHFVLAALLLRGVRNNPEGLSGLVNVMKEWTASVASDGGGKLDDADAVHHFLTLYAVRAGDAIRLAAGDAHLTPDCVPTVAAVAGNVEQDLQRMLSWDYAGVDARYDPAELAFASAVLARADRPFRDQLLDRAVRSVVERQGGDGSWPPARPVSASRVRLLYVASYEVGLALVDILRRDTLQGGVLFEVMGPALSRLRGLAAGNLLSEPGMTGWANDHTRSPRYVESWATAIVVSLLVRWRDVLLDERQRQVLRQYRVEGADTDPGRLEWPDLYETLAPPKKVSLIVSDPSASGNLANDLADKIARPILRDPARRPDRASFIIFGPPGSRKTTLLKELARALGWPLLTLSPPDFLADGLNGFERRAADIFTDLLSLRRVVVLLDECEPFFLRREDAETPGTRTQGAFITHGMLPRLQDLRDSRWIVFALATNVGPDKLDPAVTRPGRFDFQHHQDHPTTEAQERYLLEAIDPESRADSVITAGVAKLVADAVADLRAYRPKRWEPDGAHGYVVTFNILDRLIRANDDLASMLRTPDAVEALVDDLVSLASQGPERLTSP
jgi:hypothetical protein